MTNRYHKSVYFPDNDIKKLKDFTDKINAKKWRYTPHSIENMKYRQSDNRAILEYIKGLKLACKDIFEYYRGNTGEIEKSCYRVNYSENIDLILVVDKNKTLITIYLNCVGDNHRTLKTELYVRK